MDVNPTKVRPRSTPGARFGRRFGCGGVGVSSAARSRLRCVGFPRRLALPRDAHVGPGPGAGRAGEPSARHVRNATGVAARRHPIDAPWASTGRPHRQGGRRRLPDRGSAAFLGVSDHGRRPLGRARRSHLAPGGGGPVGLRGVQSRGPRGHDPPWPQVPAHWRSNPREHRPRPNGTPRQRAGIPLTDPSRTLLDLARFIGDRRLLQAVESARRLHLTSWPELIATLAKHARRGRPGIRRLRRVIAGERPSRRDHRQRLRAARARPPPRARAAGAGPSPPAPRKRRSPTRGDRSGVPTPARSPSSSTARSIRPTRSSKGSATPEPDRAGRLDDPSVHLEDLPGPAGGDRPGSRRCDSSGEGDALSSQPATGLDLGEHGSAAGPRGARNLFKAAAEIDRGGSILDASCVG